MIPKKVAAKKGGKMITALASGKMPVIMLAFMGLISAKVK
jgi:hypothetical protein